MADIFTAAAMEQTFNFYFGKAKPWTEVLLEWLCALQSDPQPLEVFVFATNTALVLLILLVLFLQLLGFIGSKQYGDFSRGPTGRRPGYAGLVGSLWQIFASSTPEASGSSIARNSAIESERNGGQHFTIGSSRHLMNGRQHSDRATGVRSNGTGVAERFRHTLYTPRNNLVNALEVNKLFVRNWKQRWRSSSYAEVFYYSGAEQIEVREYNASRNSFLEVRKAGSHEIKFGEYRQHCLMAKRVVCYTLGPKGKLASIAQIHQRYFSNPGEELKKPQSGKGKGNSRQKNVATTTSENNLLSVDDKKDTQFVSCLLCDERFGLRIGHSHHDE